MLTANDILSPERFSALRPQMEREVMDAKRLRRVYVGAHMTFLFENHLTIQWQIQEMARVEGIQTADSLAHELSTYNELLPTSDSLSTTLLIEIQDPESRDVLLHQLTGLHDCVRLEISGVADAAAVFSDAQYNEQRVSSVQFIRIPLTPEQLAAFCNLANAANLLVDHPAYSARASLGGPTRGALIEDMRAT
jgi:hypothetical protein